MNYRFKKRIYVVVFIALCTTLGCNNLSRANNNEIKENLVEPNGITAIAKEAINEGEVNSGVYIIGKSIKPGKYKFTCTETNYAAKIVIFESSEKYNSYRNAKKNTYGQEIEAIETNALADEYVYKDDCYYLSLKEGYVLLLEDGDGKIEINPKEEIMSGVYFTGDDIQAGQYTITVIDTDFSAQIIVFNNREDYINYHVTNRFTNGEESDAITANASLHEYVYKDKTYFFMLEPENVLLIKDGIGRIN